VRNKLALTLAALSAFGCDDFAAPEGGGESTSDEGQSGGVSATSTTLPPATTDAPASSDDTIGATSVEPPDPPEPGTTGDEPADTDGMKLDAASLPDAGGTPPIKQECDWLPPPEGPGPTLVWCNEMIPANADGGRTNRVAVGPEGEIYVTGNAYAGFFETEFKRALIARYSPDGVREWTQTFDHGTLPYDAAWGVAVAPGGDVLVAGIAAHGQIEEHGWIARLTPDGVPQWDLDQPALGYPRRLAAHSDGTFVVSGGEPYFGIEEPPAHITRHAGDGSQLWLYAPDGLSDHSENTGRSVAIDGAGNVYVAGSLSHRARLLAKLAPDGTLLWEHVMPLVDPYDWNFAEDVVVSPAGDVFTSGRVEDEAWMARFTTDGVEVWSDLSALPDHEAGFGGLTRLPEGDLVVIGDQMDSDYDSTIWMRRYTPDGDVVWDYLVPDPGIVANGFDDVDVTPEGDVVVVGSRYGVFEEHIVVARFVP